MFSHLLFWRNVQVGTTASNPKYQNGSRGTKDMWQDFDLGRVAG